MNRIIRALALLAVPVLSSIVVTATQPGHLVKCISGNCFNGTGEAILTLNDNFVGNIHYTGSFKHALMEGEGLAIYSYGYIHTGTFVRNEPSGYGVQWKIKNVNGKQVPDSSAEVIFGKWDEDDVVKGIMVQADGTTRIYTRGHKYLETRKVKDKWINAQVEDFLAARKKRS